MCYRIMEKQSRARKESVESNLTTKSTEEPAIVASRKSADKALSDYLASLQRRFTGRKQKQEESV